MEMKKQVHPIPPLFDRDSRILILGSFPSVKSREAAFFYGHPQNRYWKVLAGILGEPVPASVPEKKAMLARHHIAMWDVVRSCTIAGSSDTSIRDVVPNDLSVILENARIEAIFTNGAKADSLYRKHILPVTGMPSVKMLSTSPANAAYNLERLQEAWRRELEPYLDLLEIK